MDNFLAFERETSNQCGWIHHSEFTYGGECVNICDLVEIRKNLDVRNLTIEDINGNSTIQRGVYVKTDTCKGSILDIMAGILCTMV